MSSSVPYPDLPSGAGIDAAKELLAHIMAGELTDVACIISTIGLFNFDHISAHIAQQGATKGTCHDLTHL